MGRDIFFALYHGYLPIYHCFFAFSLPYLLTYLRRSMLIKSRASMLASYSSTQKMGAEMK